MIDIRGDRDGWMFCDECSIGFQAIGADRWAVEDTLIETALSYGWTITTNANGDDEHHYCELHGDA